MCLTDSLDVDTGGTLRDRISSLCEVSHTFHHAVVVALFLWAVLERGKKKVVHRSVVIHSLKQELQNP